MKKIFYMEILRCMQKLPDFKRKVKLIAVIAGFVVLVLGGGVIYAGYLGITYVANSVQKVDVSGAVPIVKDQLRLPAFTLDQECLTIAKSLLSIDTVLNRPLAETAQGLRNACLAPLPTEVPPKEE